MEEEKEEDEKEAGRVGRGVNPKTICCDDGIAKKEKAVHDA